VVTGVQDGIVRFHDPHGHPYATLPADDCLTAWRAGSIGYATEPFTARAGFERVRDVDPAAALRRALPVAARWLAGDADRPAPPGSLGGAAAVERLAELVEAGLEPWQHDHLGYFAIRVGARRLSDAAACLAFIGENTAARIAGERAQLVGAMQQSGGSDHGDAGEGDRDHDRPAVHDDVRSDHPDPGRSYSALPRLRRSPDPRRRDRGSPRRMASMACRTRRNHRNQVTAAHLDAH
jgi:hypothetical protein